MVRNDDETGTTDLAALEGALVERAAIDGKDKRTRHIIVVLVVLLLISASVTAWALLSWAQDKEEQAQAGEAVVSDVKAACKNPDLKKQLEEVVRGACATADKAAAVISQGPQGDPGEQGEQGPPPTAAQVLTAVSAYCSGGACSPSGPTQQQVNTAVARYCNGNNCTGPKGDPGEDATGEPGEPGQPGAPGAQGEQGPGPSDEQIAAAVDTYCAGGNCTGPKGDPGSQGPAGDDAFPFSFVVVVPGSTPAQEDRRYKYTCSTQAQAQSECLREEITDTEPADPGPEDPAPEQP